LADFYADENFRHPVVEALRCRGHDVLTCQQAGQANRGIADATVLNQALALGRILLTQNCDDFRHLHEANQPHCGIVNCSYDPDVEGLAQRIENAVNNQTPGGRWLVRVKRLNLGGPPRAKNP